jgi:hypothetical protein
LVATSRDLPGQFHPGRAGADERERQPSPPFLRVGGRVRHLERAVYPVPDRERVRDCIHPRRPAGEFIVAEIGLPDSGGHDEVVIAELDAITADACGDNPAAGRIKIDYLGHHAVDVPVFLEQVAQRSGDLTLGHDAGSALVEQGLEYVVLGAVDQRHRDVAALQPADREQPGESAADDHDAGPPGLACHRMLRSLPQPAGSCQVSLPGSSRSASCGPQLPLA